MSQKYFEGVCVGGIADGRGYRHGKPEMIVQQRKKQEDGSVVATGQETHYKYLLLLGDVRADLGVWVPVGMDTPDVVARLLFNYKPSTSGSSLIL